MLAVGYGLVLAIGLFTCNAEDWTIDVDCEVRKLTNTTKLLDKPINIWYNLINGKA